MFKKTILFTTIFSLLFFSACSINSEKNLSIEDAKIKAEEFINANFMDPSYPIKITSIEDDAQTGLYKFVVDLGDGQTVDSYISKDGKKFFPQSYNMEELSKTLSPENENTEIGTSSDPSLSFTGFNESASFETEKKLAIYFFWGDGCPHCTTQKEAMTTWLSDYPDIEIKTYETWKNQSNGEILAKLAASYGAEVQGVPMTFIGDKYWVGFADSFELEMENKIKECLNSSCENPGQRIK